MFRLAPELRHLVEHMPGGQFARVAPRDMAQLRERRVAATRLAERATDARVTIEERDIPSSKERNSIPVRIYRSRKRRESSAALVYFHGGAFCVGDLDLQHAPLLQVAAELDIVVISVAYRLAPEHPFPAGIGDGFDALSWTSNAAMELGIDRARIAVGGRSAGGCLAAALALMARDRQGPALAFQFLIYPMLDDEAGGASMTLFVDTPVFSRADAIHAWDLYLNRRGGIQGQAVSPYAAPARARDLAGLPPAYIMTAEYDPVRDEALEYGVRLLRAGVSVELRNIAAAVHGFDLLGGGSLAHCALSAQLDALRRGLATSLE